MVSTGRIRQEANMAVIIDAMSVVNQPVAPGVMRRTLMSEHRGEKSGVRIDRFTLAAGATLPLELTEKSLAWLCVLEGEAKLRSLYTQRMSDRHSALLPPGFKATLETAAGAIVLYAEIPDVGRIDPGFQTEPPLFTVIDWTREPVFESKRDGRKRVALVSSAVCRTKAIRAAMVIYPAGAAAPTYHLEGAGSFAYVLTGNGTVSANHQSFPARQDDLIYIPDREPYDLHAALGRQMRFLTFQLPGEFKTVWSDPDQVSAWHATDRDINGGETAQDERERRAFARTAGHGFGV
jgi:mannose-6-phosphate isomerase-like protein (cupin superfamily)